MFDWEEQISRLLIQLYIMSVHIHVYVLLYSLLNAGVLNGS